MENRDAHTKCDMMRANVFYLVHIRIEISHLLRNSTVLFVIAIAVLSQFLSFDATLEKFSNCTFAHHRTSFYLVF